jgi:intracellular septation protein A
MKLWTTRRRFELSGQTFVVVMEVGLGGWSSRLEAGQRVLAAQRSQASEPEGYGQNHLLRALLVDGRRLEVEVGPLSWWTMGIVARVDGRQVHESHPGRPFVPWPRIGHPEAQPSPQSSAQVQQAQADAEQWQRNKPSILVDIALALLFFAVSKLTGNLTTAALVGAGAGLAVVVIQRFVKADLLGGLAMFGVFTLLLSAGFSLWFQDERMVQLKGTILGTLVASLMLSDAGFNKGRYFGARVARYLPGPPIQTARLAAGMGLLGLTMAGLNLLVTHTLSKDAWLTYTTFIDAPLAMLLAFAVIHWARKG